MDGEVIERFPDGDTESGGNDLDGDLGFIHDFAQGSGGEVDHDDRIALAGEGLTADERELADERDRIRELERTRDRFERFAGDRGMGDGGGGLATANDALAVIDASERFGVAALEDDSEQTLLERQRIAEALAEYARKPSRPADEYSFYAVIQKQGTTSQGNISLNLEVPWEHRHEVFRALGEMPFACLIKMTGAELPDD